MIRRGLFVTCLLAASVLAYTGCRSCSSCHDCDPPVANCGTGGCGCHRAGSVSGHYPAGDYVGDEYSVTAPPNAGEVPIENQIEAPATEGGNELP